MKNREKDQDDSNENFERAVYRAVRSSGFMLPVTEREVEHEEGAIDESQLDLPPRLRDPFSALDPSKRSRTKDVARAARRSDEIDQSLARAAREGDGDAISSEIEERMTRDRERAESEDSD